MPAEIENTTNNQAEDWVEFSKQGTVLALHPTKKKKKLTKNINMLIGFNVSELESVCSNLEKKKVKFHKKTCYYRRSGWTLNFFGGNGSQRRI